MRVSAKSKCRYLNLPLGMQVSQILFIKLRRYTVIWKQLLFANDTNRVLGAVLSLSQDEACTDSFENFRKNRLKGYLLNDITSNPSFFSLVNTFKKKYNIKTHF